MFLPISLIFTLLRIVIPQVSQKICPQFICVNPQNITLNGQVCFNSMVINDNSLISVSKCETNSYCNYSSLKNYSLNNSVSCSTIPNNYWSNLPLGNYVEQDYCLNNSDCAGNNCTNNICYGLTIGSRCTNTTMCAATAYCDLNQNICLNKVQIGGNCITDDYCTNDSGCLLNKCTLLYSIDLGIKLNSVKIEDQKFCISGYANNDSMCEDLIIQSNSRFLCDPAYPCNYTTSISNKTVYFNNYCSCDLNGNGYAYCRQSTNSLSYSVYRWAKKNLINNMCHYYNKNGCALTNFTAITYLDNAWNSLKGTLLSVTQLSQCMSPLNLTINPATCQKFPCGTITTNITVNTNTSKGFFLMMNFYFLLMICLIIIYF